MGDVALDVLALVLFGVGVGWIGFMEGVRRGRAWSLQDCARYGFCFSMHPERRRRNRQEVGE